MKRVAVLSLCCSCLALAAAGCTTTEDPIDNIPCVATAVQVRAADGSCVWVSSCDVGEQELCGDDFECIELPPEACVLDSRCVLSEATRCPACDAAGEWTGCECEAVQVCEPKDPVTSPCQNLDEATCMATPGCQGEYGWLDGSAAKPAPDGQGDMMPEPYPVDPSWGYLRCVEGSSDGCKGLDVDACLANPACEPIWGSAPCTCDSTSGDCACPDVAVYEGCIAKPNSGCAGFIDPWTCDSAEGCHWEYVYGDPMPCDCADGTDCECAAPIPAGFCARDEQVGECWIFSDAPSCYEAGCEWVDGWQDGGAPMPCECREGEACACDPIVAPGYCQPPTALGCYDYYDEFSCFADPACEWFYEATEPCVCIEGEPCECGAERPFGYCGYRQVMGCANYYDEFSCVNDPACEWLGYGSDPMPCTCDPADSTCVCAAPVPMGYCQDRPASPCYNYWDEFSCNADPACTWNDPYACECPPDDPACPCKQLIAESFCEPKPVELTCFDYYDELSCGSAPGCQWLSDYDYPTPIPILECEPDSAYDASGLCRGPSGVEQPSFCCETAVEPPLGHCEPIPVVEPCYGYSFESCTSDPLCTWNNNVGIIPDPPAECGTDTRYDETTGQCFDAAGNAYPRECCQPYGYCEPLATSCRGQLDEASCIEAGACMWTLVDCVCLPDEPCNCDPSVVGICEDIPVP